AAGARRAEPAGRRRAGGELAGGLYGQDAMGRVQLRVVVSRGSRQQFLQDGRRGRRVLRDFVEQPDASLVFERRQESKKPIEVLRRHVRRKVADTFRLRAPTPERRFCRTGTYE